MDRKIQKYLNDVLNSICEVESYFVDAPRRFDDYCKDQMLKRAIQMNIAIIGEAINQILKIKPEIQITSARKIVDTRNYVIHGYDSVSDDMIWAIVIKHIPLLKKEVQELLEM
ncbi:MAG: DUF86 domain-containing protein [Clostridium sp.]|nr:DUF86 domain-containing protein [Clostridium sp.]